MRGYQRKTTKLPPHISKEFPGKIHTSTPYVIGKIVSRLEMDGGWALARSVRALVTKRDGLKEKLELRNALLPMLPQDQTSGGGSKTVAIDPTETLVGPVQLAAAPNALS